MANCSAASLAIASSRQLAAADGPSEEPFSASNAAALSPAPNPHAASDVVELLKHVDPELLYQKRSIDPTKNAWPFWEEADRHYVGFDAMAVDDPLTSGLETLLEGNCCPRGTSERALRQWLAENEKTRQLLDQGIAVGAVQHPRSSDAIKLDVIVDHFTVLRNLARLKAVRSALAGADKDFHFAVDQAFGVLDMGEMLAEAESLFVDYLVAVSITQMGLGAVARLIAQGSLPDDELSRCIVRLKAALPDSADLVQAYRVEFCRYFVPYVAEFPVDVDVRTLARFNVSGQASREHQPSEAARREANNYIRTVAAILENHPKPFDKIATVKQASAIQVESLRAMNQRTVGNAGPLYSSLELELRDWPDTAIADPVILAGLGTDPRPPASAREIANSRKKLANVSNPFGKRLLLDTFGAHYWKSFKLAQARVSAEYLRAAIQKFGRRCKRLPGSLEELVSARVIGAVPCDPFKDQPFQYDSIRAVIWSAGPQGDNLGEINHQGFDSLQTTWRVGLEIAAK